MNETLVKYLAGLLDADGSLSLESHRGYDERVRISLKLHLCASDAIDTHGFVASLPKRTGIGAVNRYGGRYTQWFVGHRNDLEMLVPRLVKHMVIKGKHWQWLLEFWRDHRSQEKGQKSFSESEWSELQAVARRSRIDRVGPLKPKNHPSWAWIAGYLDGDGCFSFRTAKDKRRMRLSVTAHENDAIGLEMLQKAFGGTIAPNPNRPNCRVWWRSLGPRDRSFALHFLSKLVRHSRFKKHKIEMMIHSHQQRLSVSAPAGDAIV